MNDIISSTTANELLPALESNMIAFWKAYGHKELRESPELVRFISGSPFSLFNGMMGARLAAEQVDAAIEETCQACIQHQVPALWWIGPDAQPKDLGAHLERHGFENAGTIPGMAADLGTIREGKPLADGLEVQLVGDASLIEPWAEIAWVATGLPADQAGLFSEIETQMGIDASGLRRHYAGSWKGKLVGTSLLVLSNGIATDLCGQHPADARGAGVGDVKLF